MVALIRQQIPKSKLVVVRVTVSPSASIKTFCKMGIVARLPTTLVTLERPLKKWFRFTLNFMMDTDLGRRGVSGNLGLLLMNECLCSLSIYKYIK